MAILAYDDVMLREPRLLVPRIAPVGPVKLDQTHPMAAQLAWAYGLFQSRWELPLGGKRAVTLSSVTASPKAGPAGMGQVATTRISYNLLSAGGGIITSDGAGTGDFAALVHAAPQSAATAQTLVHQRHASSPYNSFMFRANNYFADGASSSTTSAGYIYFGTFPSDGSRGMPVESRVNGLPHCWLGVRRGGVFELYEDGISLGTNDQSGNIADVYNSCGAFALGGWTVLDGTPATDPIHFVAGWDYAPPVAWCQELSRDPYSLLIPA